MIEGLLLRTVDPDDPHQIAEKLEELSTIIGNLPNMVAHAKRLYSKRLAHYMNEHATTKAKAFAEDTEEFVLKERCEVLAKQIHYAIEALRSLFASARKDIEQLSRTGGH